MKIKQLFALLFIAGMANATQVTCVPFTGTSTIQSGSIITNIYTDYLCTASVYTGGFTYAGKSWQVTLGNCSSETPLNLTEYLTYYYKYTVNGVATSDGQCHSFIAINPTNGSATTINNYISGANITNTNITNNITNNFTNNITSNFTTYVNTTNNITTYINITNNITNNITGSSNWTDLYNFPLGCTAGNAITALNLIPTCSPFLTSETDPVWSSDKPNYINATVLDNGTIIRNGNTSWIAGAVGNWTLDKPSYTATNGLVAILGNWTADKPSYTATNGLVVILGNWSADKSNYINATTLNNATIIRSSNVSWITTNQLTYNNISYADIQAMGNLTYYYNKTTSDGRYIQNGSSANLSNLVITGGNLNITAGNITYVDRNGKTRVIQDTTQGYDELTSNTLLDSSRSTIVCSGGTVNYTLLAQNGAGEWNFDGVFYGNALAVRNASILLLPGTNTTPKTNYVHFYLNSGVPTMTTTEAYPSYTHIDVATFIVGEAAGSSCVVYSYSRNRYEIDSFVNRVLERFEESGTLYVSGFTPAVTTKQIQIGTGNFFNGIFEMFTNVSVNSTADGFYFINSTGNFLQKATFDSNTFNQYATGQAVSDDRFVNVIWGIVPTTTTAGGTSATVPKLVAVLQTKPATEYTSTALAEQDTYGMANYYPSNAEVKTVFTPIARTVVRYRTGGGGTGTLQVLSNGALFRNIAGAVSSSGATPTPGTSDHATLSNLDYPVAGHTGFASAIYADSLGNWTLDKTNYYNKTAVDGLGNLTNYYNKTTSDGRYGTSNLTLATVSGNIGNWSADKASYATTAQLSSINNLSYANIASNIGNWTVDKPSYATTAQLSSLNNLSYANIAVNLGNWSSDKSSYALQAYASSLGNWSADKSSYALQAYASSLGNWSADKGNLNNLSYSQISGNLGNWSADKSSYATMASTYTRTETMALGNLTNYYNKTSSIIAGACAANQFGVATTTSGVTCAQPASANLSDSANIALKNADNAFSVNQTVSANLTVGATVGTIRLGNGGSINWNSTCTWTCFNATICSKLGTGC